MAHTDTEPTPEVDAGAAHVSNAYTLARIKYIIQGYPAPEAVLAIASFLDVKPHNTQQGDATDLNWSQQRE